MKRFLYKMVCAYLCVGVGVLGASNAWAQGFSALVTPPRFEDKAKQGQVYRNVIEISNVAPTANTYTIETADWTFNAQDAAVAFDNTLKPNSCRPWVFLESDKITLTANGKKRFRFEVRVPENAPVQECRFAILIAGDPQQLKTAVALPVAGRLGVVVYLAVGDAQAQLVVNGFSTGLSNGVRVPAVQVANNGTAHTRLSGYIDGVDAQGKKHTFSPTSFPVLPGQHNDVLLIPQTPNDKTPMPVVAFPVVLKGKLDWDGHVLDINTTIEK